MYVTIERTLLPLRGNELIKWSTCRPMFEDSVCMDKEPCSTSEHSNQVVLCQLYVYNQQLKEQRWKKNWACSERIQNTDHLLSHIFEEWPSSSHARKKEKQPMDYVVLWMICLFFSFHIDHHSSRSPLCVEWPMPSHTPTTTQERRFSRVHT